MVNQNAAIALFISRLLVTENNPEFWNLSAYVDLDDLFPPAICIQHAFLDSERYPPPCCYRTQCMFLSTKPVLVYEFLMCKSVAAKGTFSNSSSMMNDLWDGDHNILGFR
eukprot:scaffold3774_cov126-Cylindrotheca_fusiformis.AAC.7